MHTPTLATRFARNTFIARSETPLLEDQMRQAAPSIFAHEFSNLTPYAQSYGLNIERALTRSIVLEVGYPGSRGIHIPVFFNVNQIQPGSGSNASRRLIQPLSNIPASGIRMSSAICASQNRADDTTREQRNG